MEGKLYTAGEVAQYFGVREETVWAWLRTKKLRGLKLRTGEGRGTRWRITEAAVMHFSNRQT